MVQGISGVAAVKNDRSPVSNLNAIISDNARRKPLHTYAKRSRTTSAYKGYMQVDSALGRHQKKQKPGNGEVSGLSFPTMSYDTGSDGFDSHRLRCVTVDLKPRPLDATYQLRMVPNLTLTFEADRLREDGRVRTHPRVTAQWSNVIDSILLNHDSEGRPHRAAHSESSMRRKLCETPSRAPFTAFNSKQLWESASKVSEKESSEIDTSKKGEVDSDRVYRALRFVKLDVSARDKKQKGNMQRTSNKDANLKRSVNKRELQLSSKGNTVGRNKRNGNADCVSNKGAVNRLDVVSSDSPLAFHHRTHNAQPLIAIRPQADLACDTSMNDEVAPSMRAEQTPGIKVPTGTSKSQIDHGSRNVANSLAKWATECGKPKPLSTMIERPDMLLDLLKKAERKSMVPSTRFRQ